MRHCYRGRDRFRLRDLLTASAPIHSDNDAIVYSASSVAGVSIEKIVYFCVSVFWRASVCDWESSGQHYDAIRLGTKYEEQIRLFLLGEADFPRNGTIMLLISRLPRPHVVFSFPYTTRLAFNRHGTYFTSRESLSSLVSGVRMTPRRLGPVSFDCHCAQFICARQEMSTFSEIFYG
jgi:hypothetical protein